MWKNFMYRIIRTSILLLILCAQSGYADGGDVSLPDIRASELIARGEQCLIRGKLSQAGEYLKQALLEDPWNPRILGDLGRVYFHLGDDENAEKYIRRALSFNPEQEWVKCWSTVYLGKLYVRQEEFDAASETFCQLRNIAGTLSCIQEAEKYLTYITIIRYAQEKLTKTTATRSCVIHYESNSLAEETSFVLARRFQGYVDRISALLQLDNSRLPDVHIYLHPSRHKYDLWDSREILARYRENEMHTYYQGIEDVGQVEHEMVHFLTSEKDTLHMPVFTEGIAEYVVGSPWGISLDKWVKGFIREGYFVPLSQLMERQRFRQINPMLSYEEAGSFVKFLIEHYGLEHFFAIIQQQKSLEEVCDAPFHKIEQEWLKTLDTIEISDDEIELLKYRVDLGEYFHNRMLAQKGVSWVGITYERDGGKAVIRHIAPSSPAAQAGLQVGDIISKVEETPISGENAWKAARIVQQKQIGESVSMIIERDGNARYVSIIIGREEN